MTWCIVGGTTVGRNAGRGHGTVALPVPSWPVEVVRSGGPAEVWVSEQQGDAGDAEWSRARVRTFWDALYRRDWDGLGSFFGPGSEYTDVCSPPEDVARGPEAIVARLRLGLEGLAGYEHRLRLMVAEGGTVVTEHEETWHWPTGETVTLPFVSVQELRGSTIVRWWDYWDLQTLMGAAPAWWIEHIAGGYA
jgi:limonene-1,2-epoxide hydrolase